MLNLYQASSMKEARFLDLMSYWEERIKNDVNRFLVMSESEMLLPPYELIEELISDIRVSERLPCDLANELVEDLEKLLKEPRTAQYGHFDL